MGRLNHLETTLPFMLDEFDEVIVVDWSCPQNSGKWAEKEGAKVVYKKEEKYFNASRARNAGARLASHRTLCFVDADVMVLPGCGKEIERKVNLSTMVIAPRNNLGLDVHSLGGFIAVDVGHFWGVKGYDETLIGYSLEDAHLRVRLRLERSLKSDRVDACYLAVLQHSNELRGRYHKEKIEIAAKRNYELLEKYLMTHGITDWVNDKRTSDIAYRVR